MRRLLGAVWGVEAVAIEALLAFIMVSAFTWRDAIPGAPLVALVPSLLAALALVAMILWPFLVIASSED